MNSYFKIYKFDKNTTVVIETSPEIGHLGVDIDLNEDLNENNVKIREKYLKCNIELNAFCEWYVKLISDYIVSFKSKITKTYLGVGRNKIVSIDSEKNNESTQWILHKNIDLSVSFESCKFPKHFLVSVDNTLKISTKFERQEKNFRVWSS